MKFQWKYRIECTELLAATQGLYGQRIAKDATYNRLVNDQGCRNTNRGCDIKVKLKFLIGFESAGFNLF